MKNKIGVLCLLLIFVYCLSAVCAAEVNETTDHIKTNDETNIKVTSLSESADDLSNDGVKEINTEKQPKDVTAMNKTAVNDGGIHAKTVSKDSNSTPDTDKIILKTLPDPWKDMPHCGVDQLNYSSPVEVPICIFEHINCTVDNITYTITVCIPSKVIMIKPILKNNNSSHDLSDGKSCDVNCARPDKSNFTYVIDNVTYNRPPKVANVTNYKVPKDMVEPYNPADMPEQLNSINNEPITKNSTLKNPKIPGPEIPEPVVWKMCLKNPKIPGPEIPEPVVWKMHLENPEPCR